MLAEGELLSSWPEGLRGLKGGLGPVRSRSLPEVSPPPRPAAKQPWSREQVQGGQLCWEEASLGHVIALLAGRAGLMQYGGWGWAPGHLSLLKPEFLLGRKK